MIRDMNSHTALSMAGNSYCTQRGGRGLSGYNKSCPESESPCKTGDIHLFRI